MLQLFFCIIGQGQWYFPHIPLDKSGYESELVVFNYQPFPVKILVRTRFPGGPSPYIEKEYSILQYEEIVINPFLEFNSSQLDFISVECDSNLYVSIDSYRNDIRQTIMNKSISTEWCSNAIENSYYGLAIVNFSGVSSKINISKSSNGDEVLLDSKEMMPFEKKIIGSNFLSIDVGDRLIVRAENPVSCVFFRFDNGGIIAEDAISSGIKYTKELKAVEASAVLWNQQAIFNYSFRLYSSEIPDYVVLKVSNGQIFSVAYENGVDVPIEICRKVFSIKESFDVAKKYISGDAARISLTFNEQIGFIDKFFMDPIGQGDFDEFFFEIDHFAVE